jgi:ATP-dependent Clp protease ATP-binding subunit ClpC
MMIQDKMTVLKGNFNNQPINQIKNLKLVLDNFGRDLTEMAEEGKLDPVVGREKRNRTCLSNLSRRKKNNPLLIGEPGLENQLLQKV